VGIARVVGRPIDYGIGGRGYGIGVVVFL